MSIERTSESRRHGLEGSGKKSKKNRKRKAGRDAENENAEDINNMPDLDAAVETITASIGPQSVTPLSKSKTKRKVLEDVKQQVDGSIKKTQDHEQQGSSKRRKHVTFNLEPSNMSADQGMGEPVEDTHKNSMSVQGSGINCNNESKEPCNTTWVQKASWKSLVGETGRVSFSLGSIVGHNSSNLPGNNGESASTDPAKPPFLDVNVWIEGFSSSAPSNEHSSPSNGHSSPSQTLKLMKKSKSPRDSEALNHESSMTHVVEDGSKMDFQKFEGGKHENAGSLYLKQAAEIEQQNGVEKACRFMRSDNYEQEWLEAKRAVKDIFKRSRKDALKSMKMFHKKHNQ